MSVAVSVVVPHWNRRDLLPTVLGALHEQTLAPTEILVVDNGSTDDSVTVATEQGARVIALDSNRGFAHAVNTGVRAATGTWVAVVNNDVTLPPDWLERLWTGAAQAGALVAVGKLLDATRPDWLDGSYDVISRGGCAWRTGAARRDGPCWNEPAAAMLAPLTATLVRRDVFDRVGLLEEDFESYLEDVEFGLRCWRAGIPGVYVPTATARHRGSATLGRWHPDTVRRMARNQVWLVARHWPATWTQWLWPVLVGQALWGLVAVRHGAGAAWLRGKWDGLRAWPAWRQKQPNHAEMFWRQVTASETMLRALQSASGMDAYWRWYFRLT